MKIIGFIMKPIIDPKGNVRHEIFMTNCLDINGLVPKWLINATSKAVPKHWFKTYDLGC